MLFKIDQVENEHFFTA